MQYKDFFKDVLTEDLIPGGKGDVASETEFDPIQLSMGKVVEMEHTDDEQVALEIVKDHLRENPSYYSELQKAGLADELDAVGPSTGLGDPEHPINSKEHRTGNQEDGEDVTPDSGNNVLSNQDTRKMDEPKDGESGLDKALDDVKPDVIVGSEPVSDNKVEVGDTKPFNQPATPTVGKNGGGSIDGTKPFGSCEQRLMSLANIKVLPVDTVEVEVGLGETESDQELIQKGINPSQQVNGSRWAVKF